MEQAWREALRRIEAGAPTALATVIATRGSTPQKVGARLVTWPGGMAGTLGGGAVEAEARREAALCLGGAVPVVREYALSADSTDEWGLACGGTMVVFVEALGARALSWLQVALEATDGASPVAVVTAIETSQAGARLVVREGATEGTLGTPELDAAGAALGRRVIETDGAELVAATGGQLFAEPCGPLPRLVVAGAGHVGRALAALAPRTGVRVTVIDDRPEYATAARFPEADEVIAGPVGALLGRLAVTSRTAVVVAMRNQELDYEAARAALGTDARYVGLIGARRKAILVAERLAADGVSRERIRSLRSPIGLDIGARTPEEIALSILAEWLMLRRGGTGAALRLGDDLLARAVERSAAPAAGGCAP